jgi:hypothetical protein
VTAGCESPLIITARACLVPPRLLAQGLGQESRAGGVEVALSSSRTSSGSRRSDRVVNPTRSANSTETSRRSASATPGWSIGGEANPVCPGATRSPRAVPHLGRSGPRRRPPPRRPGRPAAARGRSASRSCCRRGCRSRSSDRSCAVPPGQPSRSRSLPIRSPGELGWSVHAVRRCDCAACSIRLEPKTTYPRTILQQRYRSSRATRRRQPSCVTRGPARDPGAPRRPCPKP